MIIKGRCRGNGAQLANYLLNTKDNVRAEFLTMQGATSFDPRRALLEMSLTSELTSRTKNGLYHCQLSPRADEAAEMTWEQKTRSVEIMAETLGMTGHKWALFEHEKEDGRIHMHLVFERWNHETRTMWKYDQNYEKHQIAARQMEMEFGWQLTHENKRTLDKDVKDHITDMWLESDEAASFVKAMGKAGFEVTQGIDKRPFQIVDQYGREHDLTRQLQSIRQADVSQYLNAIRGDLRPTAEASYDRRRTYELENPEPQHSENLHEISEAQDLALGMINHVKQQDKEKEQDKQSETVYSYGFKFEQTPPLPLISVNEKTHSENLHEISDRQDIALAMIDRVRQQQRDRENRLQEAQQQATEQTRPANDNQPEKYYNPVTGQEISREKHEKLEEFIRQEREREQARKAKNRSSYEY